MFKKSMFGPWKSFILLLLLHAGLHGLAAAEECLHQGTVSLSLFLYLSISFSLFLSLSLSLNAVQIGTFSAYRSVFGWKSVEGVPHRLP